MGSAQGCCWYTTQCHSIDENWFSLSQQLSVANGFLVQAGLSLYFFFFKLGFCWAWFCADLVQICFWKMLFSDIVFAFYSLSTPFPLLHRSVSLKGRVVIKISHWGLTECFKSLILRNVSYGFVNYHILQEASLMRVEWCTDLCI